MLGFEGERAHLQAFNRPRPLLAEGRALAPHVSAMMDVSDGLLLDAFRMAEASGVTFSIRPEDVPVADSSRADECMRWGDDYELLFTLPADAHCPVAATRIGTVLERAAAPMLLSGEPILSRDGLGYLHG
jgi:thiamine-monophosphate kinase